MKLAEKHGKHHGIEMAGDWRPFKIIDSEDGFHEVDLDSAAILGICGCQSVLSKMGNLLQSALCVLRFVVGFLEDFIGPSDKTAQIGLITGNKRHGFHSRSKLEFAIEIYRRGKNAKSNDAEGENQEFPHVAYSHKAHSQLAES
jgi:hypothetical protein